jgi:hypothetical protein
MFSDRFDRAIAAIDAANQVDPNHIEVRGELRPKELAHAELVTEWVRRLRPEPSEPLLLAARAHHFRRWISPRTSYPDGRAGYLRWRRDQSQRQAADVGALLDDAGYDELTIERVQAIMRKRDLASDPDVQALEDAMCLVFLETQCDDLASRLETEHMIEILRKSMGKMSPGGIDMVAQVPLSAEARELVAQASAAASSP